MDYRKKNTKATKFAAEAKNKTAYMMVIEQGNSSLDIETVKRQKSVSTKVQRPLVIVRSPLENEFTMIRSLVKCIREKSGDESGIQALNCGEEFYRQANKI